MIAKFARQINGIGHFAQIEFEISESSSTSTVVDNCNWKSLKKGYENFVISEPLLEFKEAVIKGMYFGLSKIKSEKAIEISLIDIVVLTTDSSIYSMFAVGVISIFEALKIELLKSDLELIKHFVSENFQAGNDINNFKKLELSSYN